MHGSISPKPREANGRHQREKTPAPTAVRRLRDAALSQMKYAEWGTELGRLHLNDHITEQMYEAGKKWATLAAKHQKAIGVFPVRTVGLEVGRGGSQVDPDTPEGQKIARRERNQAEDFFAADAVLVNAGPGIRLMVRRVCEDNEMPCGMDELVRLRAGLMRLVSHWNLTNVRKSGNR